MKLTYEDRKRSQEALDPLLSQRMKSAMVDFSTLYQLTQRESEMLFLSVVNGYSNREISELCIISEKTVKNHLANLMNKIGVHSMRQLFSVLLRYTLSS
ncbi:response regulator transcription factor [Paenibacillus sinopodophylli]|uniref:response regulator transcription factor n=1 Tax=Paenibacillus sinopodophylli TaxID=1837342 RepID=UPI00110CF2A6|nr:helix-turn-helix transcriptional regulator [Paenibacillus sinopodophylli]